MPEATGVTDAGQVEDASMASAGTDVARALVATANLGARAVHEARVRWAAM